MKLKRATRGVGLVLLLALLSLLIVPGVAASPATTVFIEDALDVPVGDEATVNIDIDTDEAAGIGTATILLEYDPTVVIVTGISAGDLGMPTANINNAAGETTIFAVYGMEPCPTGTVKFADVVLEAVGGTGESSPLDITVVSLYDCNVAAIAPVVTDGTFSIAEEAPPPPGTFERDLGEGLNIISTPVWLDAASDTVAEIIPPANYNAGWRWTGVSWVNLAGYVWTPLEAFYVDVDPDTTATFVALTDRLAPNTRLFIYPNKWYLVGSSPLWDGEFGDQTVDVVLAGLAGNFVNVVKPPLNQVGGSCTVADADTLVLPPFEGVWVYVGPGATRTIAGFCTTPLGPVIP